MTGFKTRILSLSIMLSLSVSPHALLASDKQSSRNLSAYVDLDKIAIDPILLKTDDLTQIDMRPLEPSDVIEVQEQSPLEKLYSDRLRENISQFGYDLFPQTPNEPSSAAVQDSYILESGDEINVLIRGGRNINEPIMIGHDGMVVIDNIPPIKAAGKTVGALRDELQTIIRDIYNTEIYISVAKTRKLIISVSGNVSQPGQVTLSTFNTVLDALGQVGGVNKNGSLRQIKLIRNNHTVLLDLYGVLIYGSATTDITLRDGDRIIVPPIGPTLAIAGAAKRPAIYEILSANRSLWREEGEISQKLTLNDMLDLSGGALLPSKTRYLRLDLENKSADSVSEVTNSYERLFGDGDILLINQSGATGQSNIELRRGSIELTGASPQAGLYALAEAPSLSYLL